MNIMYIVTLRNLLKNKRRTLVTIIGVIISVAMITAVATLGLSFLDLMKRQHIATNGEWHVQYKNITLDQLEAIKRDRNTKSVALSSDGYAQLEQVNNEYKPYLFFQFYNKAGMEQFPIEILEGKLPENENEIAISKAIQTDANIDYQIGDVLPFSIGERVSQQDGTVLNQTDALLREGDNVYEELRHIDTKTVTIVGIIEQPAWEPAWSPGYTVIGYVDEKAIREGASIDAFVVLKEVNQSLFERVETFAETHEIENVSFNNELLRFYGVTKNDQLRKTLFSLMGIIIGIIVIGSIALIYNAFAISVSERAKYLGMLASVGATKKQKRNSVFFEGVVIGAISIPLGIIAGLSGIAITFMYINANLLEAISVSEKLEVVVTPLSIISASLISIVTIFISTYVPARRASKISAIEAIRQTEDMKLTRKTVKTSKLVRKLFGIEAEIGLKNAKRNKRRYVATLFSLVISIVLFLAITFFNDNLKKSLEMTQDDFQFDLLLSSGQLSKDELALFTTFDLVTSATISEVAYLQTDVHFDEAAQPLRENGVKNETYRYNVTLSSLDEDSFRAFAKQIGVDENDFIRSDIPQAILINRISYEDPTTRKKVETKAINTEVGKTYDLFIVKEWDEENEEPIREFVETIQIGAITDQEPIGMFNAALGEVNLIVSQATMDEFPIEKIPYVFLNSDDPIATQAAIEKQNMTNVNVLNVYQIRQKEKQMSMLLSIFTYGFITLITLISIANIFNTISTSIALRKRELAMLRSVGLTPNGFHKMLCYESIFYGLKALTYGLPLSILVMFAMHRSIGYTFDYAFQLPWRSIVFVIIMIFLIVTATMLYAISKIKKENIIDSIKQENI